MIILTDLSEVLVRGVYGVEKIIEREYGPEYAEAFLKRKHETDAFFYHLMRGGITEHCYWKIFMEEKVWPFDEDEIKAFLSENFAKTVPGTLNVYKRIIGFPASTGKDAVTIFGKPEIWIVSDHIAEREFELRAVHPEVFDLASKVYWSYNAKLTKADVGFFERLLYKNKLKPDEVIFVDDLLVNLYSASNAGIRSIGFSNAEALEDDLKSNGFIFQPQ